MALRDSVQNLCEKRGFAHIKVAAVLGDDVTEKVIEDGLKHGFRHLDHPKMRLDQWTDGELQPTNAAAYIGAWGIVESLKRGADIVICGRVTDASPVVSEPHS